jgi:hypothetical protein
LTVQKFETLTKLTSDWLGSSNAETNGNENHAKQTVKLLIFSFCSFFQKSSAMDTAVTRPLLQTKAKEISRRLNIHSF